MILDAVVHLSEDLAFDPGEAGIGLGTNNALFGDEAVTKHDTNILQRSTRVILFGHAIDRCFRFLDTIEEIDDEDFLMASNAMCVNPERFPAILKFFYHMVPPPLLGR